MRVRLDRNVELGVNAGREEVPDSAAVATGNTQDRTPPGRHTLKLLIIPIIGLIVVSHLGDMLASKLAESHPLLLIAMNSRNRNLILVTNQLDAVTYYRVASIRLLLSDPLFFLLGYWYGDTALRGSRPARRPTARSSGRVNEGSGRRRTRSSSSRRTTSSACSPAQPG